MTNHNPSQPGDSMPDHDQSSVNTTPEHPPLKRPESKPASAMTPPSPHRRGRGKRVVLVIVLLILGVLGGGAGALALVASGVIPGLSQGSITQNRNTIVLQEGEAVAEVAQKVSPSVVSIVTEARRSGSRFGGSVSAAGTGIVISKNGYLLTNKHVIPDGTTSVEVVLSDGTSYDNVDVVGRDPLNDIAFLKINNVNNLTPAEIANSNEVKIGTTVIAIGNALGQFQTSVTSGIISGTGRSLIASDGFQSEETLEDLFQTDAAINSGNSGGPLVNLNGQVIGINTAVSNQGQGLGFAIPINAAKGLIKSVIEDGKLTRAYMGVRYQSLTPELSKELNTSVKYGAYLDGSDGQSAVVENSPASKTDLKAGDIITKVNNDQITAGSGLGILLAQYVPGETLRLSVLNQSGQTRTVQVTLEALPQQ